MSLPRPQVAISAVFPRATLSGGPGRWDGDRRRITAQLRPDDASGGCVIVCGNAATGAQDWSLPGHGWIVLSADDATTACLAAWSDLTAGRFHTVVIVAEEDEPGAVILRSRERALRTGQPLAWMAAAARAESASEQAMQTAMNGAGLALSGLGALDLPADMAETDAMRQVFAERAKSRLPCWTHLRSADTGTHFFHALARMVEALHCGQVFAAPQASRLSLPGLSVATQPMPWLRPPEGRHGLVFAGAAAFLLSEETGRAPARIASRLEEQPATLLPLVVSSPEMLAPALDALSAALAGGEDYRDAGQRLRRLAMAERNGGYAAALVARSQSEAEREAQMMRRGLQSANPVVRTPFGSMATRRPLGAGGATVFVYPGAGSAYPGLGRDLYALFPGLTRCAERLQSEGASWFGEAAALYPPDLADLDADALAALETRLTGKHATQFAGTVLHALMLTTLVKDRFGLQPQSAMGYCVGEVSMIAATGLWGDLEEVNIRQAGSAALNQRVYGRMQAVRDAWGLGPDDASIAGRWQSHVVFASPEAVAAALSGETRVYLTIVNTPTQCVVAGYDEACARVIARLGCRSMPLQFNTPGHSPAIASERGLMAALHRLPVTPDPSIVFHAQIGSPLPQDADAIAAAIAHTYTNPVDFPRLVETAYAAGGRVFLELGARQMCSGWIGEILGGRPHLAIPLDIRGIDPAIALVRAAAQLVAHRIPVDLGRLFGTD